ncbi:MAG: bZIP transcription factor [Clostridia bacterium]|jgi:FtsZ-binding cell division protein ZapB|nr:bZIP transcription factor [Clostridia bacterium]
MNKNTVVPVLIGVIVTAIMVWGLATFLRPAPELAGQPLEARVAQLEEELQVLQAENQELTEQVAALREERDELRGELREIEEGGITRQPKPGWQEFFPSPETTTLEGKSTGEVRELLGVPPVKIRSIAANPDFNREIWIYMAGEEDPTGLYLWFKGNQLWRSLLDEFNGLYGSGLLEDEEFWLN